MSIVSSKNFHLELLRQLSGVIFILDPNSKIIYTNDRTAKLCGHPNEESIIGHDASELPCEAAESAADFFEQDQYVLTTKNELTLLDIHVYADNQRKIFLAKKSPFYLDNKLVGVLNQATELTSDSISKVCSSLINSDKKFIRKHVKNGRSYSIGKTTPFSSLSPRELDCLFYLIRGKTMKETAIALTISPRTVETYIEHIKHKTQIKKRSDMIDYAISNGYLNYIPESYFTKNISCILN